MESMRFSFLIIIIVFMLRINSYILNEPNIFYNLKKFNIYGFRSNFGAKLIPHWTIAKNTSTNQSTA